ncbi:MAG: DUF2339 domain-containing protein [Lutibacter sp.]|uniref:DUF2339 domain-containing protein n=1 Tax=Lutibacter sp. TaxID=1925666 RepID=UPI0038597238
MTSNQDQINQLLKKLETLLKRQEVFSKEVNELQKELTLLKNPIEKKEFIKKVSITKQPISNENIAPNKLLRTTNHRVLGGVCSGFAKYFGINKIVVRILWFFLSIFFGIGFFLYILLWIIIPKEKRTTIFEKPQSTTKNTPSVQTTQNIKSKGKSNLNLEKFIGENLINKIGIAIIIIGVAIGTKYSIEHDLISPLTRVILGYLVGLGLLGFGIKLKKKYVNFSAVLVSGAIAILYFMTYAAYSFYELFPQTIAFTLMVIFTIFTIIAALNYNKQIIAHIGLVGAYAVPFLLSENSGNTTILFSYMAIINIGILVIAFKKYWKPLYFSSFILTWLIFTSWHVSGFKIDEHFGMALIFTSIFFAIFYTTFLAFKLIQKEKFNITDILLLLANSFVFYGFGYSILDSHEIGTQLLGVFTLCNGLLHFFVSIIIYKQKLGDKNLFYLVSGLVLIFITIAIPVQLDGNWVTLLWIGEAALLFWIGRTKKIPIYEYISYPLMALAVFSIHQDWSMNYNQGYFNIKAIKITPILNIHFLTSLLFISSFGFIYWLNTDKKYLSPLKSELLKIISFLIPAVLLSTLYLAFRLELENYWQNLYNESILTINEYEQNTNYDLIKFKTIWVLNYSLLFVSVLSFLNIKKLKNRLLGKINLVLNAFAILVFLLQGLYAISELRESYLEKTLANYYEISTFNIGIRYVSFGFIVLLLISFYKYISQEFMKVDLKMAFDLLLHTTILWILSSELINLMDLSGSSESYKLGLSILWGIYSLSLISLGIWKTKKHLRIGAIGLFAITLLKLFFYDISHLNTISKTIVFLSLGILLLIISFLYNKFKYKITDEIES